ncbi:ATPase family AAA domain-containing protein 2-like isoform X2 [Bacillus rossius redtenbacheri]|uniref:ATPase family AAA domain-containing protein 2-like isoform X2 n=1 Tax=Bacillus rossius redtenbacheri TaxID=93214 RepID=UPI002FDEEE88
MSEARSCGGRSYPAVGGLEWHLDRLHQMVMVPTLCREVYDRFHVKPPRGILFYGPPGTGKTLVAGALARECSLAARRVEFFYRKSADILSMWLGESEKALTELFEEARRRRPAIIFFDEIDGLAPVRSARADHVHVSIVSTLLALMDGLEDAAEVVVIGATNRLHALDPALRRPGRFDAELFFPLPGAQARLEILKLVLGSWRHADRPDEDFLQELASCTAGYCGADLHALCRDAVTVGLCRQFPHLASHRRFSRPSSSSLRRVQIKKGDFLEAKSRIVPATRRARGCVARQLSPSVQPLFAGMLDHVVRALQLFCPFQFLHPEQRQMQTPTHSSRLLLAGKPSQGHTQHLAPAVLDRLQHLPVFPLDTVTLCENSAPQPEGACVQVVKDARGNAPSILYLPDVGGWWGEVGEMTRTVFLTLLRDLDPGETVLVLATADCPYESLPDHLRELFREELGRVVRVRNPTAEERDAYFRPLRDSALRPPAPPSSQASKLHEHPASDQEAATDSDCEHPCLRSRTVFRIGRRPDAPETASRRHARKRGSGAGPPPAKRCRAQTRDSPGAGEPDPEGWVPPDFPGDTEDERQEPAGGAERVDVDVAALDAFFEHAVAATDDCPFQTLEALHSGLSIIIHKYSSQLERRQLLLEMQIFMKHFEEMK